MSTIIDLLRDQKSIAVPCEIRTDGSCVSTLVNCPVGARAADVIVALRTALEVVAAGAGGGKLNFEEDEKIKQLVQSALLFADEPVDISSFEVQSKG